MKRTYVTSSNIVSIGYSCETRTLEIEFKGYSVYQYTGVPKIVYEELMHAESHGKYFHKYIRNIYPTIKIL